MDFEVRPSSKLGARDLTCIKSYPLDDAMVTRVTASQRRPLPSQILGTYFWFRCWSSKLTLTTLSLMKHRTRGIAQHAAVLI